MTKRAFFSILLLCGGFMTAPVALASEPLGVLRLEDVTLRPQAVFGEKKQGQFELGESSAALAWHLDDSLSAKFRFGAHALRGKPAFYKDTKSKNDLDLLEAYAEYQSLYGRFRLGLIPLDLGREGSVPDGELIFPRAQIFSRGLFGLRDFGFNYFTGYNQFFTEFSAHNGESEDNLDNKTWFAARWGYDFKKLRLEAFGETGSTTSLSTAGSTLTVARFDPTQNSKWRMGGFYADWVPSTFRMSLEVIEGDATQNKETFRFLTGSMDLGLMGKNGWGMFLRYNPFDPDTKTDGDATHDVSVAVVRANASLTSKLILIGTKRFEEGKSQIPNDEIRLVWSATPFYDPPRY